MSETATVEQVAEIREMLARVLERLDAPARPTRSAYTVEEVAALPGVGVTPYTVREWCRTGRIHAGKRAEKRGGAEMWSISSAEVERYRNEGLLPVDMRRNPGR